MRTNTIIGRCLLVVLLVAVLNSPLMADRMFEDNFNGDLSKWNVFDAGFVIASRTGRSVLMNSETSGYTGMYTPAGFTPIDVDEGTLAINFHMQWNGAGSVPNISRWTIGNSGQPIVVGEIAYAQLNLRESPGQVLLEVFAYTDAAGSTASIVNATNTTLYNSSMRNVTLRRYVDGRWELYASGATPATLVSVYESTLATGSRLNSFDIRDWPAGTSEARYYNEMYIDGFPVPEPTTMLVLGAGALLLSVRKRNR